MTAQSLIPFARREERRLDSTASIEALQSAPLAVDARLIEDLRHIGSPHYWRLLIFLALYILAAFSAFWIAHSLGPSGWVYLINLPLYLLAAASLHGISLFTPEGVHGTLSTKRWWNRALCIACALPVLQYYSAYKVLHLLHHHHLGEGSDPDHYAYYTHSTWREFLQHLGS